jgi:hypothetical protein
VTDTAYWWERRRDGERTSVYLARVLGELGPAFGQVANYAEACHYDDFRCPPDVDDGMNISRLLADILRVVQVQDHAALKQRGMAVAQAAKDGEFDATKAEADEWAQSEDGQAAYRLLLGGQRPHNGPRG